ASNHPATTGGEVVAATVAAATAATTTVTGVNTLNSATLNVGDTSLFPAAGAIVLLGRTVTYTGKTATSFAGASNHPATTGGEVLAATVAAATAATTTVTGVNTLTSATLNVGDTSLFPAAGAIVLLGRTVTYTGKTATSFAGASNHPATTGGE